MAYRQRDSQGNLINFNLVFERSSGTGYYLVSLVALDADRSRFIYDNPFRDFQITHELLQGIDGNYHEPVFHVGK
ncbi:hypothetical protein L0337_22630 [candidate division KSB1 bacterium]|nr:hypothetical protein [candidate division KSB1 bacterium]